MSSKIANLSELDSVLCNIDKTNEGVLHFVSAFKIGRLLRAYEAIKSKGFSVSVLLTAMIFFRLRGGSVHRESSRGYSFLPTVDENTYYRLLNHQWMDWRRVLQSFAKQFCAHVQVKGDPDSGLRCFVLDDTDLPKTGKTIEFISRVFNHISKKCSLGFKMLLLGYWDGKSLIAADYSMHREQGSRGDYGLMPKERRNQFKKQRDKKAPSLRRIKELNENKNSCAVAMIKRAVRNGFKADYVLMDSWFIGDQIIKAIRGIKNGAIHVLGLCKTDRRKYVIQNQEYTFKQLLTKYERKRGKYSRKYKSRYIPLVVDYKQQRVKLFLTRHKGSKKWMLLLSTDLSLSFIDAIERYQIRWSIEVLFKECKQYLRLGSSQNTDFDGQIADTTLTLITHTILTLQKRFGSYETMGGLFREMQQKLLELTLWERLLRAFVQMISGLLDVLNIDVEETMSRLMQQDNISRKLMTILSVLDQYSDNDRNMNTTVISPV